jgi:hypothetical protein
MRAASHPLARSYQPGSLNHAVAVITGCVLLVSLYHGNMAARGVTVFAKFQSRVLVRLK